MTTQSHPKIKKITDFGEKNRPCENTHIYYVLATSSLCAEVTLPPKNHSKNRSTTQPPILTPKKSKKSPKWSQSDPKMTRNRASPQPASPGVEPPCGGRHLSDRSRTGAEVPDSMLENPSRAGRAATAPLQAVPGACPGVGAYDAATCNISHRPSPSGYKHCVSA